MTKWDNELCHDFSLLFNNCTVHVVTVKCKHISLVFYPLTLHQLCDRGIIHTFKEYYRTDIRKKVNRMIDHKFCSLRAYEIAKKITVLEDLYLAYKACNIVCKITIRLCYDTVVIFPVQKKLKLLL